MLIIPCIILFRIFYNLSPNSNYSIHYSQNYCQNNPVTLEMILLQFMTTLLE